MVAPATTPDVVVAVGDVGGGADAASSTGRCFGDALESTASRALTTHSSPYDMSDDEPHDDDLHPTPFPLFPPAPSKVVDETSDFYRSAETPRSAPSIRSIQIQIESVHNHSGDARSPTTPASSNTRRRRMCGRGYGPTCGSVVSKRPLHFRESCRGVLLQTLIVLAPPVAVLVALHFAVAYVMLFVLNVVVALAAWEWNWWSFRIRKRLLLPLQQATTSGPPTGGGTPTMTDRTPPRDRHTSIEELQDAVLNEQVVAITKITKGPTHRSKYFVAGAIALLVTGVVTPIIVCFADSIVTKNTKAVGKNVLLTSSVTALLAGVFCACLTATPADAFIVFVYEACFVVSSLNSFLSHHEHLVHDPELLDSMYVLLVGACAIVVWRIVSSKEVMESTVMAMTDILGLAYLVAPMMAMADFLGHPDVEDYDDIVGTFFVVVSAAEAAYQLNQILQQSFPRFLRRLRRPVVKRVSNSLGFESLTLSFVFGAVASIVSMLCFHGYIIHWQDALLYLGTIFMSQFCRLALESMKALAKTDAIKYQPWLSGYMDLVNPYLLAMIVFHPYVKALIRG